MKEKFLKRKDVSKLLQVSTKTLTNWAKKKILVPHTLGRTVRYLESEVLLVLKGSKKEEVKIVDTSKTKGAIEMITEKIFADMAGINVTTVSKKRKEGTLPYYVINGKPMYYFEEAFNALNKKSFTKLMGLQKIRERVRYQSAK